MKPRTAVVKDPIYLQHFTGSGHPESHHRLEVIYDMLQDEGMEGTFKVLTPRPATQEELALNHAIDYIEEVASTAGRAVCSLDLDTVTSPLSWEAAQKAVGGVLVGLDAVMAGEVENCFALVRPPGHHAEKRRGMGFCLFNNVAIAAAYARRQYDLERILIVDWDLHHGNGTQNAFYQDPQVLFFSTHQYPYYPGSGSISEKGEKEGKGFTVNVPLPGGQGDKDYGGIYRALLLPIVSEFKPQLILVSAGYDIYFQDPLGAMDVTPAGFATLASLIRSLAHAYCQGKMVVTLEGGYHLKGLRDSVKATLQELSGDLLPNSLQGEGNLSGATERIIEEVKAAHRGFWRSL